MIKDFISQIKTDGLSRSNRYRVLFSPPANVNYDSLYKILLLCDQVQLPGYNYSTTQSRTFGEIREMPYERLFDSCNMSFYVDTDLKVKRLFDSWMATIQDPVTRNYNYYDRYTTNMTIEVQDLKDKTRYSIDLYEVYPKTMSSVTLDYSAKDVMKFNVTMQYRYWVSSGKTTLPNDAVITNNSIDLYSKDFSAFQDSFSRGGLSGGQNNSFSGLGNGISIDRGIISTPGISA